MWNGEGKELGGEESDHGTERKGVSRSSAVQRREVDMHLFHKYLLNTTKY